MRSRVPACSISSSAIPRSATISISVRISLKFKLNSSGELVAEQLFGPRELESRPPVVSIRLQNQKDVILRRHSGDKRDVPLGHQGKLQHVSGIQLCVREADRFDEAAELRAHYVEGDVIAIDAFHGDAIEPDQAHRERPVDTIANSLEHLLKRHAPPPSF